MKRARAAVSFFGLVTIAACAGTSRARVGPASSLFIVPTALSDLGGEHFYDHPWPSDLRRDEGGAIRLAGIYDPTSSVLIRRYEDALAGKLDGFSPSAAGYLRFDGDLDPSTLPASPADTLTVDASVQLVDVDARSPERGQRHPAQIFWRKDAGVYWLADTLAVGPALGFPLRPSTTYAIVVTNRARASDGSAVTPDDDLTELLGMRPPTDRLKHAREIFTPAIAALGAAGIHIEDIAHLTVFTTGDPAADLFRVADDVRANVPPPTIRASTWQAKEQTPAYDVYEAAYGPSPNYQTGTPPYRESGGDFAFDAEGRPILQGTSDIRISIVVPNASACSMPPAGYPLVLYAHGTGGNYRSVIDEHGSVGSALASKCLASLGYDQMFHGTRIGAPPPNDPTREGDIELLFFNFANPNAMRTNNSQSAIDLVQQARLFTESHAAVPSNVSRTHSAIAFDASKLLFFGHSQGGQNGPLFFAVDGQTRGGVLSGASVGVPITLLEKTKPTPSVAGAMRVLLGLSSAEASELTLMHPILSFAQTVVDPTDPINYVAYTLKEPRAGFAPKSILLTEGVRPDGTGDSYAPPHGIEVSAVATGLPRMAPGTHDVVEMTYANSIDVNVPQMGLAGNLAGGRASGVLAQFLPASSDGHFVVFDVAAARELAAQFCRNLADEPCGRVPALR